MIKNNRLHRNHWLEKSKRGERFVPYWKPEVHFVHLDITRGNKSNKAGNAHPLQATLNVDEGLIRVVNTYYWKHFYSAYL